MHTQKEKIHELHCNGEYCNLIHQMDRARDLIITASEKALMFKSKQNCTKKSGRERAYRVLKMVLTKDELDFLEDNAYITHLSIPTKIRPSVMRLVPKQSIDISKEEQRIAYLELRGAEALEGAISKENHVAKQDLKQSDFLPNSLQGMSKNLAVCEMCFQSYKLLCQMRCLRHQRYKAMAIGQAEDGAFGLSELINSIEEGKNSSSPIKGGKKDTARKRACAPACDHKKDSKKKDSKKKVSDDNIQMNDQSLRNAKKTIRKVPKKRVIEVDLKNSESVEKSSSSRSNDRLNRTRDMQSFYFDEHTVIPYLVAGRKDGSTNEERSSKGEKKIKSNLIICHDLFETQERMEIFLSPIIEQNPGHNILLWNYPGQAYSTFSAKQRLNNEFHANCLEKLLIHIGVDGTKEFDSSHPFCLVGYGYGGSVACLYAKMCPRPSLRSVFLVNPLSFIDTHYASIIHDCRNVFRCSPESRPDLPQYFYSRFLFSDTYLEKTSTPFALNLYTAVHNPITIQGRVRLCDGVLDNLDLRDIVKEIYCPIISLHGDVAGLIRPLHANTFIQDRQCCQSIYQAFNRKGRNSVIITTEGGHELLQEKRKTLHTILAHLLSGFYEKNNAPLEFGKVTINNAKDAFEFAMFSPQVDQSRDEPNHINLHTKIQKELSSPILRPSNKNKNCTQHVNQTMMFDPKNPLFERQNNIIYKPGIGSSIYPAEGEKNRASEYMSWRLQRNRKRLSRFQRAARVIQSSLRVFMAKTMIARLKRETSARSIQRVFRGMCGRIIFMQKSKELWAARLVQRNYRGSVGRKTSYNKRVSIQSQIHIARVWRGSVDRREVKKLIAFRNAAAISFQSLWRRVMALRLAGRKKLERNSATVIQRVHRGFSGRRLAEYERERYIFSRSQNRGIELGRKMLAEHKIHVSRLQSELSIMKQENTVLESKAKFIVDEISNFKQRAERLENSMQDLSIVESEQNSNGMSVVQREKIIFREKKMKLDEEFTSLLTKICDRKNQLQSIEHQLAQINRRKTDKERALKLRERKLVALLESQENEIQAIKRIQERKVNATLKRADDTTADAIRSCTESDNDNISIEDKEVRKSLDHTAEKNNQLMESTETMMKFGFMSMSMTYFTSMNMMRAMKSVSPQGTESCPSYSKTKGALQKDDRNSNVHIAKQAKSAVTSWEIDHVVQWLRALSLGQYEDAFRDGSVDGPFLCQLTDDDLANILGIEHKLHRKKINVGISQLKMTLGPAVPTNSNHHGPLDYSAMINSSFDPSRSFGDSHASPLSHGHTPSQPSFSFASSGRSADTSTRKGPDLATKKIPSLEDLSRWVRNQKYSVVKEALSDIPTRHFDSIGVRLPFLEGSGTVYEKSVSDELFHLNQSDEHGNTLLHIAAQNGNSRLAKLLIEKGANPNHQNKQGQTPGHFAVAYQFYELASWLFDEDGGNGNDLITNMHGLGPYDGLNPNNE